MQLWMGIWGGREDPRAEVLAGADGDVVPELTPAVAPRRTTAGHHPSHPREWSTFEEEGVAELTVLLCRIERIGTRPRQVLCNEVVFVGKPSPATGPSRSLRGCTACGRRVRKAEVRRWEGQAAVPCGTAPSLAAVPCAPPVLSGVEALATQLEVRSGGVYSVRPQVGFPSAGETLRDHAPPMVLRRQGRRLLDSGVYPGQDILAGCGISVAWQQAVPPQRFWGPTGSFGRMSSPLRGGCTTCPRWCKALEPGVSRWPSACSPLSLPASHALEPQERGDFQPAGRRQAGQ